MKKMLLLMLMLVAISISAQNTGVTGNARKKIDGRRVYVIGVSEDTQTYDINEKISNAEGSFARSERGLIDDLFFSYRGTFTNKAVSAADMLIDAGIMELAELVKDHRKDWAAAVRNECRFSERFSMNQEISDFYYNMSSEGAMDLNDIAFRGFSFRQYIRYNDETRSPLEVLYAHFSLDTTQNGINRMVHHSKFQVVLDSLRFNPYLCEIPNDSVKDPSHSIGFDFERRKDFRISLNTTIKSSWVCENMTIVKDYSLGDFHMEAYIDPALLDPRDSCFKYSVRNPSDSLKLSNIKCSGESFMVPRSYIGLIDDVAYWGTGQYHLEVNLSESCSINESYYLDQEKSVDGKKKWNRKVWKKEWRVIKKRRRFDQSHISRALHQVSSQWTEGQWVTEIFTPGTSVLVSTGEKYLKDAVGNAGAPAAAKGK